MFLHSKECETEEPTKRKSSLAKHCNHADLGVVRGLTQSLYKQNKVRKASELI